MKTINYELLTLIMSTISLLLALIPLVVALIKHYLYALKLIISDKIAYDEKYNVYAIKLINMSSIASVNNLNISFKLLNKETRESYNLKGFTEPNLRLSAISQIDEIGDNEISIQVDVMSINRAAIAKSKDKNIIDLYEHEQLKLIDLLRDEKSYLFVEINALNELTGQICTFPIKKYYKQDIVDGFFTKGDSIIRQANNIALQK